MVQPHEALSLKVCRFCQRQLPIERFYQCRPNCWTPRCKECHGLAPRQCQVCHQTFVGKPCRKECSKPCHDRMRPPTFLRCQQCEQLFGPVEHLRRRFCSSQCKVIAQSTGRKKLRRTTTKAKNAQSLLRYHVQAGHIIRPATCEECGAIDRRIEGAHFNYDEPLRVRWLCVSCHRRWDKREPKRATYVVGFSNPNREAKT